jgi:hypothetical protein
MAIAIINTKFGKVFRADAAHHPAGARAQGIPGGREASRVPGVRDRQ